MRSVPLTRPAARDTFGRTRMFAKSTAARSAVTVLVPGLLRDRCDGAAELRLPPGSVRTAMERLREAHPALYRSVCDETGAVRRHINLFVNIDDIRELDGLDTQLAAGDELIILPAVSGG